MRNLIISAAALLACAVPGVASAQDAFVDVFYGNASVDAFGSDTDVDAIGVDGVYGFDFGQVGGHYANLDGDGGDVDAFGVDGHIFSRGTTWQWGGGVAYNSLDDDGTDADEWAVAAEGLYFLSRSTIAGSVSYSDTDLGIGDNFETVAIDGEFRHFINDNFRVSGSVGFGNTEIGPNDADLWSAGVGAEYQFAAFPVSVYGGYEHFEIDDTDFTTDAFKIGARWNFGGNSLFDRDRSGANLSSPRGIAGRLFGL